MSAAATLHAPRLALAPARPSPLLEQAQRLWPDSERNQREWLRAVRVVRSTSRGWLLDRPVQR